MTAVSAAELGARFERFTSACRKAGLRLTQQRIEVFREVAATAEHPDTEAIFRRVRERMPTVSLDTVYRTLRLLADLGLVTTLAPRCERTRFDANIAAHHHFVCERCGLVRDFEHAAFDALDAPPGIGALGTVTSTSVEVKGLCRACAARGRRPADGKGKRR